MGKRQRAWAKKAWDELIALLGGVCVHCGEKDPAKLEVDHIEPRDWDVHREWSWRVSLYRQEAREGKLQVLCGTCNKSKRRNELPAEDKPVEQIWNP